VALALILEYFKIFPIFQFVTKLQSWTAKLNSKLWTTIFPVE